MNSKSSGGEIKAALVFCMNPNVPFKLACCPSFCQAYGKPANRLELPKIVAAISLDLKRRVRVTLKKSNVCPVV